MTGMACASTRRSIFSWESPATLHTNQRHPVHIVKGVHSPGCPRASYSAFSQSAPLGDGPTPTPGQVRFPPVNVAQQRVLQVVFFRCVDRGRHGGQLAVAYHQSGARAAPRRLRGALVDHRQHLCRGFDYPRMQQGACTRFAQRHSLQGRIAQAR